MTLNPEQQLVVQHHKGPMRVAACAGSGKTTALIERYAYLVEHRRVSPSRILMITFSRAAREEMAKRIDKRLPGAGGGRSARTFHSIGLMIYKEELDRSQERRIDTSGILWMKTTSAAYKSISLPPEKKYINRLASIVKNDLLGTDPALRRLGRVDTRVLDTARLLIGSGVTLRVKNGDLEELTPESLLEAYYKAETIRASTGVVDKGERVRFVTYDDMIYETAMLLKTDADTRARWGSNWDYIMQDECQDVNNAQNTIAQCLAEKHRNYAVVGDAAQAVFGFRGARPRTLLDFADEWPGATTIFMHRNYRSGIEIADYANKILEAMPIDSVITDEFGLPLHQMVSERNTRSYVGLHRFEDAPDEGEQIAKNIEAHYKDGVPYEEQAILVRMNRMTRDVEIGLALRHIPYKLISGVSFFAMKETRALLGYARVVAKRADGDDLTASLKYPGRMLRSSFIKEIVEAREAGEDWLDTASRVAETARAHENRAIHAWGSLVESGRLSLRQSLGARAFLVRSRNLLELDDYFRKESEDSEDNQSSDKTNANLDAVCEFASRFDSLDTMLDVVDEVVGHLNANKRKRKAVRVSTVHKAKGKEWDIVYVPQLVDGLFPVTNADRDEERRIFYVACSRARDELWLSFGAHDSEGEPQRYSHFIDETQLTETGPFKPGRKINAAPIGTQIGLF